MKPHVSFDYSNQIFLISVKGTSTTIIIMAKINEETFLLFIFIANYISPISFSMIISFF